MRTIEYDKEILCVSPLKVVMVITEESNPLPHGILLKLLYSRLKDEEEGNVIE